MELHIVDIETGKSRDIDKMLPEFKYSGRAKDPDKKQVLIDIAVQKQQFKDWAAISALTGRVVAIGHLLIDNKVNIIGTNETEEQMLEHFWDTCARIHKAGVYLVGHNLKMFDLPFLIRRSWKYGIKIYEGIWKNKKWWEDQQFADWIIDTSDLWLMDYGTRYQRFMKDDYVMGKLDKRLKTKWNLDILTKHFNGDPKIFDGKDFEQMWDNDRATAITYLTNDLLNTKLVATKMLQIDNYQMPF